MVGEVTEMSLQSIIEKLWDLVDRLERMHPGRKFTLDGHLLGSIGEVLAAERYDLQLFTSSRKTHDAETRDGRGVQIKVTSGTRVGLRDEPTLLLVLHLGRDGTLEEVYNGPGGPAWALAGGAGRNGQSPISLVKLRTLMRSVSPDSGVPAREVAARS